LESKTPSNSKIVFVCQVYYPDQTSTSQLFHPIMKEFVKKGFDVMVLCGYPSGKKCNHKEVVGGVKIVRNGLNLDHKKGIFYRGIAYVAFLCSVFARLLFIKNGPRFIGVTNPPFNAHLLFLTSKIKKRSFEYMLSDLHPEGILKTGMIKKSRLSDLWIFANKLAYSAAGRLFVLGRDMRDLIATNYDIPAAEIEYLPHWSSTEVEQKPLEFSDSLFVEKWKLADNFVVQYSGNMGIWHDMETLVRAAAELTTHTKIKFLFIGGGIKLQEAKILAKELECDNIIWKDFVDYEMLSHSLAAAHLALVSLKENLEGVAVPCKLYGILASGRPVIAVVPKNSEVALTVLESGCGVHVEPKDVSDLVEKIKHLSVSPDELKSMGKAAFRAYTEKYTINSAINQLLRLEGAK
jgi:colanic acid biosynthesis glycosyl transferase WcaI